MFERPKKGVWSRASSSKWEEGYFVGNGETGGILYGTSAEYNLILNHHSLYLKTNQTTAIPDMSDSLKELRAIIKENGYQKGIEFFEKTAVSRGYHGLEMSDVFHPAAELLFKIKSNTGNQDLNYFRGLDFEKGLVSESFKTAEGQEFSKKLFAPETYNTLFFELSSTDQFAVQFSLKDFHQSGLKQESRLINYNRVESNCIYGDKSSYKVSVEWDTDGVINFENTTIILTHATKLRLAVGFNTTGSTELNAFELIEKEHIYKHRQTYNQVSLNIADAQVKNKSYEELIHSLESEDTLSVAIYEKLYDASRYFIHSMTGPALPNLQGIWSGDFNPPWSGDFTFDTNVQLAIASLASLGLYDNFSGLFHTVKAYEEDFKQNAQRYFGCRGYLVPVHASTHALHVHWNNEWPLIFWTAGAGWLSYFYNEYYSYTKDKQFLEKVALPFYQETLLFFEDFIEYENETAVFRPSYSAENGMGDSSTMDVAVVKATISYLRTAYSDLKQDMPDKYGVLEDKLPDYLIDEEGVLKEWIDESAEEHPNHRHFSNLYPVFQSKEITSHQTELWDASHKAFDKRLEAWLLSEDGDTSSAHGRMHAAMCAIALERPEDFEKAIHELIKNQSFFPSFATSHYNQQNVFNVDANGSFPKVIHDSLLYPEDMNTVTLFKAVPTWLKKGTLKGIHLPNNIKISHFFWDLYNNTFEIDLISTESGVMTLLLPKNKRFLDSGNSELTIELNKHQPYRVSKRLISPGAE
ncbi:MAG: glycoside hydrolase N-terminal domain-containing protein [Alkalibacterium sp.]|nr:glycoside hydrolase N-terminal domain-containing protein [Alkalibacterium sp.]